MSASIHLCGSLSIEIDGARLEEALPGRQGVVLFAFLVLHRDRPREREVLMDALWPGERPASASASLRALLSKLRGALGQDALQGRELIQLVLTGDAWVDVEAADEAIHRAESAIAVENWGEAWGAARVALMVPERGFLVGHDLPWIDERRRELERTMERAERCIAMCGLALGGSELMAAEKASRRLVERRPLDEAALVTHMKVLAASDDTAGALEAFESFRIRLREELGTAPGEEVRELHRRLLGATAI